MSAAPRLDPAPWGTITRSGNVLLLHNEPLADGDFLLLQATYLNRNLEVPGFVAGGFMKFPMPQQVSSKWHKPDYVLRPAAGLLARREAA